MKKLTIDAKVFRAVEQTVNELDALLESSEEQGSKSLERVQFLALSVTLAGSGVLGALNSYARWGQANEVRFDTVRPNSDQPQDHPDLPSFEQLEFGNL